VTDMIKQHSRTVAVVCTALLVSLVVAAGAAAGFKAGRYAGTTSQGEEISFKVTKRAVKDFDVVVDVACADGSTPRIHPQGGQTPTKRKGRFKTHPFIGEGFSSEIKGRLKRARATGKIKVRGTAPSGARCARAVKWSATRRK
jgi:hypothetical protein